MYDKHRIQIAVTTLRAINISHSIQERLLFKVDYVCNFPHRVD